MTKYKGWLLKRPERNNRWRRRWFFLKEDGKLYYYKDFKEATTVREKGFIDLRLCTGIFPSTHKFKDNVWTFQIETHSRVWYLSSK